MDNTIEFDNVPDGELYKWENPGQIITGVLKSYKAQPDRGKGPGNVYEVLCKEGMYTFFAPSLLHKKLQNVTIGDIVQIKYESVSKTNTGNTLKNFSVGRKSATPEVLEKLGITQAGNTDEFENLDDTHF